MVLVIRTHDPQGRLPGPGLLLILAVCVHGRKYLSRWSLEQGAGPSRLPLAILPEPTSRRPSAFVSGATSLRHELGDRMVVSHNGDPPSCWMSPLLLV